MSDLPLAEITLRKYESPYQLGKRELVKKVCLSFGLLQPGDSRDVIVDVLYVLIKEKKDMTSEQVKKKVVELRKKSNLELRGIASSNVRRQLLRLRSVFIVEKVANNYRITENEPLSYIFEEKIEKFLIPSLISRTKDYFKAVDKLK